MKRMSKVVFAGAIVAVAAIGVVLLLIREDSRGKTQTAGKDSPPSFTLFSGVGSTGSPDTKPKVEFQVPGSYKQFARDTGPFNLEGLTVVKYVEKYRAKAREDNTLAFHLYQAEALCAHVEEYTAYVNNVMAGSQREPMYRQIIKDEQEVCAGISPALMNERYQFLQQAAAAGVDEARIAFYLEGPAELPAGTPILPDTPVPADWAKTAVNYLQASAAEGNRGALYILSEVYSRGALNVSANPQQGLTYMVAAMALRPDGDTLDLMQLPVVQRSGLTPDQQAAAVQQGKALAAQTKGRHS